MKLTIVGFWGAYPEKGGATSSYLLEKDGFRCLIDCGSGALAQLPNYTDPFDLDAVIVSHYHQDHIADIGVLQYSWLVQNGIRKTEQVLPIYGHQNDQEGFERLTHNFTKGIAYDPEDTLQIGPFTITFMETDHPVTCYAMRITDGEKVIVYTADSSYKDEFNDFSKDANLLITDCNFYQGQDGSKAGHMNSEQVGTIAKSACVDKLVLSHHPHFGDRNTLVDEAKQFFDGEVILAHEGYTWEG
ncbi:ribonuclease BN (tRNA processing enzyme) [Natronobacillus azotifigens]|uniref:MBL fold metallo-hydrolase n=1 Tax=Natronobacillus azotifigens TaxID=472978 RepID=A0A9J6RDM7_9BACI|nr:MBL fold metallo-hydrolase [Natronobacillus azotifigens]MCZ0703297.1 MBL fold metallo-hydrolase [Natronobacillus azotifigens]